MGRPAVAWTAFGITAPTLITVGEMGMNQNQPRSGRVTIRMSPARRPSRAGHALELRVHRDVAQDGVHHAPAEALGQEPGPPGGVHDRGHAHGVGEALGIDVVEGRALVVEDRVQRARPCRTSAPLRWACRSRTSSKRSRGTW